MSKSNTASVRIGLTKRPDIWEASTKNDAPGPGNYADDKNNIGKNVKGAASMGSKYKPARNDNPGPGQYSGDPIMQKSSTMNGKISQAQRQDIWAESTNDLPGPGNYAEVPSSFGTTRGVATMGGKYKPERNDNPGPGQYDNDASKLRSNAGASVRIGSAKREDIWKESMNDLPGPGNYVSDTNTFG